MQLIRAGMRMACLTLALAGLSRPALAHPHVFAEARLELQADDAGMLTELRNVWRFDEVFSSSLILDFDKNQSGALEEDELKDIGETIRKSLANYNYFQHLTLDGHSIKVAMPPELTADWVDGKLLVLFAVKPEKPMPIKGRLSFGVYDPTLYTSIDFASDAEMATFGSAFDACQRQVVRPDPDQVLKDNQDNLTQAFFDDPAGTNMAKLFAVRLEVTCS